MGSSEYPAISGTVRFYQTNRGVLIKAEIGGLPYSNGSCANGIFGFHIHEGGACTGSESDPFANTGPHYDRSGCPHPQHSGDMPPLFGNRGFALMAFLTDRFTVDEIIGKTVVIHSMPDDFTTQPSGNSGKKIACGIITAQMLNPTAVP